MPQERREKALAILASGVDEARWAEVRPGDREKRREVMAKLEAKFRSEPEKVKKLRPYTHKRLPWKVGDVISLRMGRMCEAWRGALRHWPFDDLYTAVVVMDIWEQDIGDIYDIPVVALYHWIGAEKATMEDLAVTPFLRGDDWFRGTEELERKKQEEWEIFRKRYSDPIQKERLWSAIFEGEGPPLPALQGKRFINSLSSSAGNCGMIEKTKERRG